MDNKLTVLYGSQTGTAQEVAERIWRESRRYNWTGPVMSMDSMDFKLLPKEKFIIFVCATTGQGEEPDNMKQFWKFLLNKNVPFNFISNTHYAVLGLGDSSYVKFGFAAKRLNKRLSQIGGTPVMDLAIADDQHDMGQEYIIGDWIRSIWKILKELVPDNVITLEPKEHVYKPRYKLNFYHNYKEIPIKSSIKTTQEGAPYIGKILENTRTTNEKHFQDVRLIKITIPEESSYSPGDVLQIQPENSDTNVELFLELFKLDGDTIIELEKFDDDFAFDLPPNWLLKTPCTVRECAKKVFDLQGTPQIYSLQLLSHFSTDITEKEKLIEFCEPGEGREEFYGYCTRPRRTILELLFDFHLSTATFPKEYLFDLFKTIKPRSFSIASANEVCNDSAEILVAVVKYYTKLLKAPRLGLCSNYLANLSPEDTVPLWIQKGSLKFPQLKFGCPIIFVAAGTGCAPFRSYIQRNTASNLICDKPYYNRLLFFLGFRNKDSDYHLKSEWEKYDSYDNISVFTAFSRDQDHKIYVQHILKEQSKLVYDLIDNHNAFFYVAGNSKNMPQAIRETLVDIIAEGKEIDKEEAEIYVQNLEKRFRYQTETWS